MRILVTGSRDWPDGAVIADALARFHNDPPPTLVVGDCPSGADAVATMWAGRMDWPVEVHEADWERHGRWAGPRRNIGMVIAGADLCLAFLAPCSKPNCDRGGEHYSHGTTHCANTAERAGIDTRRFTT